MHTNYLVIILKCRFWFSGSGWNLRFCISNKHPGDPAAAALWTQPWAAKAIREQERSHPSVTEGDWFQDRQRNSGMFIPHRFASTQIQPTVDHKHSIHIEKNPSISRRTQFKITQFKGQLAETTSLWAKYAGKQRPETKCPFKHYKYQIRWDLWSTRASTRSPEKDYGGRIPSFTSCQLRDMLQTSESSFVITCGLVFCNFMQLFKKCLYFQAVMKISS